MSDHERYEAMMLDHVYGLLEPEQVIELNVYLSTTSAGESLRQQAEAWQRQLAAASKSEFPEVQFVPPPKAPVRPAVFKPQVAARRSEKRSKGGVAARSWSPWAMAASVAALFVNFGALLVVLLIVVAIAGFGVPLAFVAHDQDEAAALARARQDDFLKADQAHREAIEAANATLAAAERDERSVAQRDRELHEEFDGALREARKAIESKRFIVRLSGPGRAQPGAPNEWRVEMYHRNGARVMPGDIGIGKVEWVVKDQAGTVLYQDAKVAPGKGSFREPPAVNLPVSFWERVKPNSDLSLEVVAYEGNLKSKVNARIPLAPQVYVTHLATDKPLYVPGETVYFRSLTLDRASFTPPDKDMMLEFRITKPGGQPETILVNGAALRDSAHARTENGDLLGPDKKPLRGFGCGAYDLAPDAPGGEYVLSVVDITSRIDEVHNRVVAKNVVLETRKFNVIKYEPENILKTLEFDGKSYGPGDVVMVKCTATPIQGGKKKLGVRVSAKVDGQPVAISHPGQTDADGVLRLKFTLPKNITKGVGSIDVTFFDGAEPNVISRSIPLIGRIIQVEFFPEGGDLIEDVPNRVYFQAVTPSGKPADLKGFITDGRETVAEVGTLTDADLPGVNRGQGSFVFTPKPGKTYFLKVRKPEGILEPAVASIAGGARLSGKAFGLGSVAAVIPTGFELPKAKADGVVLTALDPVTNPDQPIRITLQTGKQRKALVVGAYARGNLVDHQRVEVEPGQAAEVSLKPTALGGVTRLTVFQEMAADEDKAATLVPVAERLVYHKPAQKLKLSALPAQGPNQKHFVPGSQVNLEVLATDEEDKAVPAVVMVAVVNQSVLTMADEKTGRLMPTHFLLASEVKKPGDLEHADFLLSDDPKAGLALDLLLGTQGWRRFAEQATAAPKPVKHNDDVERLLVCSGQAPATVDTFHQEALKVYAGYLPRLESSQAQLATTEAALEAERSKFAGAQVAIGALASARKTAYDRSHRAWDALRDLEDDGSLNRLLVRFCVSMLLIAGFCLALSAVRRRTGGIGYFATAAACFSLCAVALVGWSVAKDGGQAGSEVAFRDAKQTTVEEAAFSDAPFFAATELGVADKLDDDRNEMKKKVLERAAGVGGGGRGKIDPAKPGAMPQEELNQQNMAPAAAGVAQPFKGGPVPALAPVVNMPAPQRPQLGAEDAKAAAGVKQGDKAEKEDQAAGKGLGAPAMQFRGRNGATKAALLADGKEKQLDMLQRKRLEAQFGGAANRMAEQKDAARRLDGDMDRLAKPQMDGLRVLRDGGKDLASGNADVELELLQANLAPGFYVREFRFQKAATEADERSLFTETVCWQPVLVLPDGQVNVQFQLSDAIARYQVLVAGHTLDGRIGAVTTSIEAHKPFTVDPKVPFEITANDRVDVPIRVVNDSDAQRALTVNVVPNGLAPADSAVKLEQGAWRESIELGAYQKGRKIVSFRSLKKEGDVALTVIGTSDPVAAPDQVIRTFRVVPDGFPASGAVSDLLEKRANASFNLPGIVKGTLKMHLNVYPTTLADLQQGLEGLIREPGGCFEQTSSSNYPNLLILDYLKSADQAKPELTRRAKEMLDRGYARLVSFECPDSAANNARHGFEWFGMVDQQHQALTAYGLLQFKDLARAYPGKVDPEMIKRTQQYLLGQQKPAQDGFRRNERALDSFGRAPDHITTAYIVWALTESDPDDKEGMTDLLKQLEALKKQAKVGEGKDDPYFLALVANALLNRPGNGNRDEAVAILERIAAKNLKNGCVDGASTSITCSGGRDLQIETTALAVLAWLRSGEKNKFTVSVKEATKWIGQQRGGYGGFGSTQSTILALKALIEHTKASRKPAEDGEVRLTINGKTLVKKFTKADVEVITLEVENPEDLFKQGANEALIEISTKEAYPFSLAWSCSTQEPVSSEKCALELATNFDRGNAPEGDVVQLNMSLKNKLNQGHGMAVAVLGLPGGCRLPADMKELTKLREDGKISFFEVRGRELVLYWRSLKPNEAIDLSVSVVCDVPGEYTGPASRAYLYYNADHKHWVKPLSLTIAVPADKNGDEDVASK
jgi:hypothetical protein